MKSSLALPVIAVAMVAAQIANAGGTKPSLVTLTNDSEITAFPDARSSMPPPTTQQELWTRILTLLQKNHGFVSRADVESTLGLTFSDTQIEHERLGITQYLHKLEEAVPGVGWVSVGFRENPERVILSVTWGPEFFETPNCLPLDQATRDWNALGWQESSRTVSPGRGSMSFYRAADRIAHLREEKPLHEQYGLSQLVLFMPSQYSQCVNGAYAWIWRAE
jgi:hypothetical protein